MAGEVTFSSFLWEAVCEKSGLQSAELWFAFCTSGTRPLRAEFPRFGALGPVHGVSRLSCASHVLTVSFIQTPGVCIERRKLCLTFLKCEERRFSFNLVYQNVTFT